MDSDKKRKRESTEYHIHATLPKYVTIDNDIYFDNQIYTFI